MAFLSAVRSTSVATEDRVFVDDNEKDAINVTAPLVPALMENALDLGADAAMGSLGASHYKYALKPLNPQ